MSGRGLKILKYPDPRLKEPTTDVEPGSKEAAYIVKQLLHSMSNVKWGKALGMAAPQLGIPKRVFVVLFDYDHIQENGGKLGPQAFLNPRIVSASKFVQQEEGCYSLEAQKFDYKVKRPQSVVLEYQDVFGAKLREQFTGRMAGIIAHEYDHIEGRTCVDLEKQKPAKKNAKTAK